MRKTIEMDTYICDNCGRKLEDEYGCIGYADFDIFDVLGSDNDWIEQEGKHYCPNCYEIDEDDNVIIKQLNHDKRK